MEGTATFVRLLADEPITRAYLFGSHARGDAGPLSDVDVAILPNVAVDAASRWPLQARIAGHACDAFHAERADVVLLDEAPAALAFAAISGRLLLDREPDTCAELEARIASRFHDHEFRARRWQAQTLERYRRGEFA